MNKKNIQKWMIVSVVIFIISISFSGCIEKPIELDGVEINEYQGEQLSSINDFRENSIKGPQTIIKEDYALKITGLIKEGKELSYEEIINDFQSYKKIVRLNCVEGWSVDILWQGILIKDIINEVQPIDNASIIIFHAEDGYTTSLPVEYIIENDILMAYKMNNVTLPEERGFPFQLVAESKWGYKWIKWITEIEISNNFLYKGYWESRGYSNTANINESFFD